MEVIHSPEHMAEWGATQRRSGRSIGFVPTMGALHEGHLALVRQARAEGHVVACSIFVNPLQFNDPRDLANYPVRTEEDQRLLRQAGCDAVFLPVKEDLFSGFQPQAYDLGGLDRHWEGPLRPGHFQGVANVVQRLFRFVRPDAAFFGEKDRQQLAILQWVARTRRWPERIVACPTVREPDGLAMSSRNLRLSPPERAAATVLHRALQAVLAEAKTRSLAVAVESGLGVMRTEPLAELEYLGIADPETLAPLDAWPHSGPCVALLAARVGPVRLIDNLTIQAERPGPARG